MLTGDPIDDPAGVTSWLKNNTGELLDKASIKEASRCAFCWRGQTPNVVDHTTAKCSLLTSINKIRQGEKYKLKPLEIHPNSITASTERQPKSIAMISRRMTVELKAITDSIKALDKCTMVLEGKGRKKKKKKSKANDQSNNPPPSLKGSCGRSWSKQRGRGGSGKNNSGATKGNGDNMGATITDA
jgi:hypothetical protein